jgi:hypothetical protein
MEKKTTNFLIYYNTGLIETSSNISPTLLHMIEVGVVKFVYDIEANKAWIMGSEGIAKQIEINNVINI